MTTVYENKVPTKDEYNHHHSITGGRRVVVDGVYNVYFTMSPNDTFVSYTVKVSPKVERVDTIICNVTRQVKISLHYKESFLKTLQYTSMAICLGSESGENCHFPVRLIRGFDPLVSPIDRTVKYNIWGKAMNVCKVDKKYKFFVPKITMYFKSDTLTTTTE